MDPELKQYLEGKFASIDTRFDAMDRRFEAMEAHTATMFAEADEREKARIEKAETNLLTAFHSWARPMEVRVRGLSTMTMGYEERLSLVEERVSQLERRPAS